VRSSFITEAVIVVCQGEKWRQRSRSAAARRFSAPSETAAIFFCALIFKLHTHYIVVW
jgi:hypothetical protein